MREGYPGLVLLAALLLPAGALAMSPSRQDRVRHCSVIDGEKLPLDSGGANAICAEVERATAARAPDAHYKVEITVLSPSRLAAMLTVNGRTLPLQNFAVMDRNLNDRSIQHFADSLAAVVAEAARE